MGLLLPMRGERRLFMACIVRDDEDGGRRGESGRGEGGEAGGSGCEEGL